MSDTLRLRPQSRWLVREMARDHGLPEQEVEAGLLELIAHGHVRVLPGAAPGGLDAFEMVIKDKR